MGWLVRNKSAQTAVLLRDGQEQEVDAGQMVDIRPIDGKTAVRSEPETWERVMPSDPDYVQREDRA